MRRQFITLLIILACLGAVTATRASAQSTRRFIVDIPFQFVIAGRALPAGNYSVERIDPAKPNVVLLKNADNGMVRLFITQRIEKDKPSTDSCLMFKVRSGKFQLFQVWVLGYQDGNQVPPENENERRVQSGNNTPLVRLTGNNKKP